MTVALLILNGARACDDDDGGGDGDSYTVFYKFLVLHLPSSSFHVTLGLKLKFGDKMSKLFTSTSVN